MNIIGYSRQELLGRSGIYRIICLVNNKCYVGSTVDLYRRFVQHRKRLRGDFHHSKRLQRAWNKYGADKFAFEVIEFIANTRDVLLEREVFWINELKAFKNGYNSADTTDTSGFVTVSSPYCFVSPAGDVYTGTNVSAFARKHGLSATSLLSLISRPETVLSYKGWKLLDSREQRKYLSFTVVSPDGITYTSKNLKQFAQEHGLSSGVLQGVVKGRYKHHRGWTCPGAYQPKENLRQIEFEVEDPFGCIYKSKNLLKFCREHGLHESSMHHVVKGHCLHHQGWTLPGADRTKITLKPRPYKLRSPSGVVYCGLNLTSFAKQLGVRPQCLYPVLNGRVDNWKGWTKA